MKAEGLWAWWNQYGTLDKEDVLRRAKDVAGVIVKHGYWQIFDALREAGVRVAVERYAYPQNATEEGEKLAEGIARGAEFAVINAEVEWEGLGAAEMTTLINRFRERAPGVEIYASTDTRGNRTTLPYQQVLGQHVAAWMPMVYPTAFRPSRPPGSVASAFHDCLDSGQDWQNKPVLPTVQAYGGIGPAAVREEAEEVEERKLGGCQIYTIGHATGDEWTAFITAQHVNLNAHFRKVLTKAWEQGDWQRLHDQLEFIGFK
jgi:hypothetical protein